MFGHEIEGLMLIGYLHTTGLRAYPFYFTELEGFELFCASKFIMTKEEPVNGKEIAAKIMRRLNPGDRARILSAITKREPETGRALLTSLQAIENSWSSQVAQEIKKLVQADGETDVGIRSFDLEHSELAKLLSPEKMPKNGRYEEPVQMVMSRVKKRVV